MDVTYTSLKISQNMKKVIPTMEVIVKDVHKPRSGVSAAGSIGEGSSEIYSNTN